MPAIKIRGKGKRLFPRSSVGTINNRPQKSPAAKKNAGPAKRTVRGMTGLRGRKQPFGAEPGGGVRNREKGANCLSAASSCPAGSAARRPGSSQRQGCPFAVVWRRPHDGFFSLGRQRKERHPAGGAADLVTRERQDGVPTLERGNDHTIMVRDKRNDGPCPRSFTLRAAGSPAGPECRSTGQHWPYSWHSR